MSYLDDLKQYEREHPAEYKEFVRKFGLSPKSQKPDKLHDFRDQRLNRPEGFGSIEPEIC